MFTHNPFVSESGLCVSLMLGGITKMMEEESDVPEWAGPILELMMGVE